MPKTKTPLTPEERLRLAKRYLRNAKEVLKKSPVDKEAGIYEDIKYVSEASGTAYISALEALKALFMFKKGWDVEKVKEETKEVGSYRKILKTLPIGKDKDVLIKLFSSVYDILHLGGYYRELQDKKAIDSGFEKVEKIIQIVEKHIKQG
ncbi:MAG: DUF5618 family protein [candidate division WOR-3 bacterium]